MKPAASVERGKRALRRPGDSQGGFTLVEMLVVIAIISVLAAMMFPVLSQAKKKARYVRWLTYSAHLRSRPSLVAYYTFMESEQGTKLTNHALGKSIERIHPEKLNGVRMANPAWVEGRWPQKKALNFSWNYVEVPNTANGSVLDITGDELAIECWFRVVDPTITWGGLCGNYISGIGGYMLVYTDHGVAFYNGKTDTAAVHTGTTDVGDGKWHHVLGSMVDGTMNLYVDGQKTAAEKYGETVLTSTWPFVIGRYYLAQYFIGMVDEVAVYSEGITEGEAKGHYDMGRP